MAEDFDTTTQGSPPELPPTDTPPEVTPPAPASPTDTTPPEWQGRIDKANDVINNLVATYEHLGYTVDRATGAVYAPQDEPAPIETSEDVVPSPDLEPEEFQKYLDRRDERVAQAAANAVVKQMMPMMAPVAEMSFAQRVEQIAPHVGDLKAETLTILRDMGYRDPSTMAQLNPRLVNIAVDAARGRRGSAPATPTADPNADRATLLAAAASLGGAPGGAAPSTPTPGVDPSVRTELKSMGWTDQEINEYSEPVSIGRKAGN